MALDEIDGQIIALLEANGREPATKLAAKVGLSRSAVQERVARLERDGIIAGYTIRIGGAQPSGIEAYLILQLDGPVCRRVAPQLGDIPEVRTVVSITGELDMLVRARVADMAALAALAERVSRIRDVKSVVTAPVLTVHHDRGG